MLFYVVLSATTATLALAAIAPLVPRATCKPNFEGNFLSIYTPCRPSNNDTNCLVEEFNADNRLGAPIYQSFNSNPGNDSLRGRFIIEYTGQPQNTYHIKLVANTERSLQAAIDLDASDSTFTLQQIIYDSSNSRSQDFDVECEECSPNDGSINPVFGRKCVIRNNATGRCVTSNFAFGAGCSSSNDTSILDFTPCERNDRQLFNIRQAS